MSDYKAEMGNRIRSRRKSMSFTQEQMAEKLNISVKHFSEVERGKSGLSIESLVNLSNILGLSLDYIVKGDVTDGQTWNRVLSILENVPKEKEAVICELIRVAVELAKD